MKKSDDTIIKSIKMPRNTLERITAQSVINVLFLFVSLCFW